MEAVKSIISLVKKDSQKYKVILLQILISIQILYEFACVVEMGSIYITHPISLIYEIGTLLPALYITFHFECPH